MREEQINLIGIYFCGIIYKTIMHERKKNRERKEGPEENVRYTDFV